MCISTLNQSLLVFAVSFTPETPNFGTFGGVAHPHSAFKLIAALELIDRLLTQLKGFKIPVNFYMDLSKAFDSLSHDILLNKLTYYGVKNSANDLLRSYLSNRKQYVQIDDISSSIISINTGVPQGSILGPLLFNICINDIIMSSDKFNFILYADDTTLNATIESFGETVADIQLSISNELQKILGYEPAGLTVHPPPQNDRGWVHFFRIGI